MKVKELLIETSSLVRQHSLNNLRSIHHFPRGDLYNRLITMEEKLSWDNLIELFSNSDIESNLKTIDPFVDFLANRWTRIKDIYQLTYPKTSNNPLTQVCVSLARELSVKYFEKRFHYLELLMPTINTKNEILLMSINQLDETVEQERIDEATALSRATLGIHQSLPLPPKILHIARLKGIEASEKDKIHLHHFILDRSGYVINIQDCIANVAFDQILKHPSGLETVVDELGQVPGYELRLMSKRMARGRTHAKVRGIVNIYLKHDSFSYLIAGMGAYDIIDAIELGLTTYPLTFDMLVPLQPQILEITSKRGHTYIKKQPRELLPEEEIRILHHSKEAKAYHQALIEELREKDNAYNAVDALNILVRYLNEGGMRGGKGGTDSTSGLSSYVGIRVFYDFTKTITAKEWTTLLEAGGNYQGKYLTFKMIWCELLGTAIERKECNFSTEEKQDVIKLITPHFDAIETEAEKIEQIKMGLSKRQLKKQKQTLRVIRPILCSEQFARQITEIIKAPANAHLVAIIPEKYIGVEINRAQIQSSLEKASTQTLAALKTAIQLNKLTHYSEEEIAKLPSEIGKALVDPISESFIRGLVTSVKTFMNLLRSLPREHHVVVVQLLTGNYLQESIINTREKVHLLFSGVAREPHLNLMNTARAILSVLSKNFLQSIVADEHLVYQLKLVLPSEVYRQFLLPQPGSPQRMSLGFLTTPVALNQPSVASNDNENKASNQELRR
ncbi:MAG: hypothetical protein V4501_01765 [Pseudomonadota bacterium]